MSETYEQRKEENLSDLGRERLENGGYYEVTLLAIWHGDTRKETDLVVQFVLDDEMKNDYFDGVPFAKRAHGSRKEVREIVSKELSDMLARGLVLHATDGERINSVDELQQKWANVDIIG